MPENLLALAVRPLDIATPILQARRIQQSEAETAKANYDLRQNEMGSEFRGLAPFVNHPEFGQRWTESMDRMAQKGILDPQRHAQLRNSPSPFLLQQGLAMTSSGDQYLKMQELEQSRRASANFGSVIGGMTGQPSGQPSAGQPPAAPSASMLPQPATDPTDPTMSIPDSQVAAANAPTFNDRFSAATPQDPNARPVQTVAQQVAPAGQPAMRAVNPATGNLDGLVRALSQRGLPEQQLKVGLELLKREISNSSLTNTQREYYNSYVPQEVAAGRQPKPFNDYDLERRRSGATMINTTEGAEAAAQKARLSLDLEGAKDAQKQALAGTRILPILNTVEQFASKTPGGWAGPVSASMARAASGLGLPVSEGMSNAELLQSASQFLIPIVREPGATAATEMNAYLRAVPGLMQSQEGRQKVVTITKALVERSREIAKVYRDHLGKPGLYAELAKLDKPAIPENLRADVERAATDRGASVVPQEFRTKSAQEQLNAAPVNSIATIEGVRRQKQPDGTWKAINGR